MYPFQGKAHTMKIRLQTGWKGVMMRIAHQDKENQPTLPVQQQ
jgi:hypothetical protein